MKPIFGPATDGIDHVNIYSAGRTELGRFMSNFAQAPIQTIDGSFASIEGYWYWLGCEHTDRDTLRTVSGFAAKKLGRALQAEDWPNTSQFRLKIAVAILQKLVASTGMCDALEACGLPFTHYYVFAGKTVYPNGCDWLIQTWNIARNLLRGNTL